LEAVRLSEVGDKSVAQVARELGIRPKLLYRWRMRYLDLETGEIQAQSTQDTQAAEIRKLEKQLRRVELERDILKKALAIFSQER
jgi:transposase